MAKGVETTKQKAAMRQACAAIAHFHKGNFECAITLAGAAEGQVPSSDPLYLFKLIRQKFSGDETNVYINWMKHSSGPDAATITEQEVVVTIIRAIQKFVAAYEAGCNDFNDFSAWCIEHGYTKQPLMERPA